MTFQIPVADRKSKLQFIRIMFNIVLKDTFQYAVDGIRTMFFSRLTLCLLITTYEMSV